MTSKVLRAVKFIFIILTIVWVPTILLTEDVSTFNTYDAIVSCSLPVFWIGMAVSIHLDAFSRNS